MHLHYQRMRILTYPLIRFNKKNYSLYIYTPAKKYPSSISYCEGFLFCQGSAFNCGEHVRLLYNHPHFPLRHPRHQAHMSLPML